MTIDSTDGTLARMNGNKRRIDVGLTPQPDGGFLVFVETPDGQRAEQSFKTEREAESELMSIISLLDQSKFLRPGLFN